MIDSLFGMLLAAIGAPSSNVSHAATGHVDERIPRRRLVAIGIFYSTEPFLSRRRYGHNLTNAFLRRMSTETMLLGLKWILTCSAKDSGWKQVNPGLYVTHGSFDSFLTSSQDTGKQPTTHMYSQPERVNSARKMWELSSEIFWNG
ncbi:hypothetical protein BGX38DRAFT_1265081 [Terfezia claveryi]|nr:hypothetical protein BGX38DRAFT_1265081 [Terfezia claveryi]